MFGIDAGSRLKNLTDMGLFRHVNVCSSKQDAEIVVDGRRYINFCSNDYLGLAKHPRVISAFQQASATYGVGSSASPMICGKSEAHELLEQRLAKRLGRERVVLMSSGYMANLAIISALITSRSHSVYMDKLCHASMVDGAVLSRARIKRYHHADPDALKALFATNQAAVKLVLTESVFSMDGDIAPLSLLAELCSDYQACLIVDDAHGFGVLGDNGLGGLDYFCLGESDVPLLMGTLGKALGVYGAFVAGPSEMIELIVQHARPYIYSTALPAAVAAAALEALSVQEQETALREHLFSLIGRFRAGLEAAGIYRSLSTTPIQPLIIGSIDKTLNLSQRLQQNGIFVTAIRPPTVPQNSSRLRITLSASHTKDQVDYLLEVLCKHFPEDRR